MDSIGSLIRQPSEGRGLRPHLPTLPANLRPIDPRELAVKLEATLAIWPLPDQWPVAAPYYREALADVPADLVDMALKHVRTHLKWFPKPCELREPIERLLHQRQRFAAEQSRRQAEHAQQLRERSEWESARAGRADA